MSLVDELVKVALLGATWVLYLLFGLSLLSVGAALERIVFFRRNRQAGAALRAKLTLAIHQDQADEIAQALAESKTLEGKVLGNAFAFRLAGAPGFLDAVESELGHSREALDRGSVLLGTIGNNAPFIGLFGTVLGVIEAFSYLGQNSSDAMQNVMAGIAEALVATAVGIFVAIPAVIAFNLVQKRAGEIETTTLSLAKLVSAWLHQYDRQRSRSIRLSDQEFATFGRRSTDGRASESNHAMERRS